MSDQVTNVVADVHTALEYAVHDLTHQDGDGSTIIPRRSRRGRKRKPAPHLNAEDATKATKKVQTTMKNVHMESTLRGYRGYCREINEFYVKNHPDVCDMNMRTINRPKLLDRIMNPETMKEEIHMFMTMISSTQHATLKNPDGTPQIKRMGSLNSLRSAFNWYIFVDMNAFPPPAWHLALNKFYTGLKNQESMRKQAGDVPMKEGRNKLQLNLYMQFAKYFFAEDMVAENFTNTWAWNLMCRSMNISTITASALSWAGDCIGVEYGMDKMNKKATKIILKHVFANPFQPEVCEIINRYHTCYFFRHVHLSATCLFFPRVQRRAWSRMVKVSSTNLID